MNKKINHKSNKDVIIVLLLTSFLSIILINIDAFEKFSNFAANHEEYELDEIILILLVFSFSTIWYSIRRYLEIKQMRQVLESKNIKLNQENLRKDELLLHQTKMASLGEMLENIAHQWRQPLSTISSGASGIKIKKEYDRLEDNELEEILDNIIVNTQYLSDTIESFKHFIKEDSIEVLFNLDSNINKNLNILKGSLKISDITVLLDLNTNIEIYSFPNELTQVFINIINNSKDALESNNVKDKFVSISSHIVNNDVIISIKDNANGIPLNIINKIFEPYFTTKYKSQGTGLGLFMSYKIITERMEGEIYAENCSFKINKETFPGVEFNIKLPLHRTKL